MEDVDGGDYESGPFCVHWGDPGYCERVCLRCGHECKHHWVRCDEKCCSCEAYVYRDGSGQIVAVE
jgi:hypothetical protein